MVHGRSLQVHLATVSLAAIAFAAAAGVSLAIGQQATPIPFKIQDEDRERYQSPGGVLKALELASGDWAADVGAGNGYYSQHMAEIVGPTGRVFAEDIADYAIEFLHQRVQMFNLRNVEIIKGTEEDPKLPPDSLAGVLVVNAYHHFTHYEAMLRNTLKSLRPGGRLVLADYSLPDHRYETRAEQLEIHEVDPALVRAELEHAGFRAITLQDPYKKRMPDEKNGDRIAAADMWLMVAVRLR